MTLVEKVPLQVKVGELEGEIRKHAKKLEEIERRLSKLERVIVQQRKAEEIFESGAWKDLWTSFDRVMKKVFS